MEIWILILKKFIISIIKVFKEFGCVNLGWNNYIDKNTNINWVEENKKGKIILKTLNNTQVKNIYYLEKNEQFKTIIESECETGECAIEIRKIL